MDFWNKIIDSIKRYLRKFSPFANSHEEQFWQTDTLLTFINLFWNWSHNIIFHYKKKLNTFISNGFSRVKEMLQKYHHKENKNSNKNESTDSKTLLATTFIVQKGKT